MGLLVGLQESVADEVACGTAGGVADGPIRKAVGGAAHGDADGTLGVPTSFRFDSEF